MKRKITDKTKLKLSNKQHSRLYDIHRGNWLGKVPSQKGYRNALIKMCYHKDVLYNQENLGRILTLKEKKFIFNKTKKDLAPRKGGWEEKYD